jgi:bacteriocin biosynthesis cyclodehydratase domain-containing protein
METEKHKALGQPLHLLSVGAFGKAVGRHLKNLRSDVVETVVTGDIVPMPEVWPKYRLSIVASWRPDPNLCAMMEELSYESQRPLIPLIVESTVLRLGPVVVPGQGSCWSCWIQRIQQHSDWREAQSSLLDYYANHPEAGPRGYLEPFAGIAAARLTEVIEDLDSSGKGAGYVWEIDMMSREIETRTAIGIHDCPRCGLHKNAPTRSYSDLQQDLGYLWPDLSQEGR